MPTASDNVPIEAQVKREDYNYTPGIGAHKVHNIAKTWQGARSVCQSEGADLAIMNSALEAEIVLELLLASGSPTGTSWPDWAFVGLNNLGTEGQFETVRGQPINETGYNKWTSVPVPNDGWERHCATIYMRGQAEYWYSVCEVPHRFVCELAN